MRPEASEPPFEIIVEILSWNLESLVRFKCVQVMVSVDWSGLSQNMRAWPVTSGFLPIIISTLKAVMLACFWRRGVLLKFVGSEILQPTKYFTCPIHMRVSYKCTSFSIHSLMNAKWYVFILSIERQCT